MNTDKPKIQTHSSKDALFLVRVVSLSALAVIAAAYAIHRHYFAPRAPMLVPAPEREIPAPALEQ